MGCSCTTFSAIVVVLVGVLYTFSVNPDAFSQKTFKHVRAQSLNYLSRPHTSIRLTPLPGPANWTGAELQYSDEWKVHLNATVQEEIVDCIRRLDVGSRRLHDMQQGDFVWPMFGAIIRDTRRHLRTRDSRGFVLIRDSPTANLTKSEREAFFWGFGLHLGHPGAQNKEEQLLVRIEDSGLDSSRPDVRGYKTRDHIGFHVDFADVVGLLCLRQARRGGESRIASSVAVYNQLLKEDPSFIEELYKPMAFSTKGEGGVRWLPIDPVRHHDGHLSTVMHTGYFRSVYDDAPDAPQGDRDRALSVVARYSKVLEQDGMSLSMRMRPGDIQLLSNHVIVHSRGEYFDDESTHDEGAEKDDDIEQGRVLLRLWISLNDESATITATILKEVSRAKNLLSVIGRTLATKYYDYFGMAL